MTSKQDLEAEVAQLRELLAAVRDAATLPNEVSDWNAYFKRATSTCHEISIWLGQYLDGTSTIATRIGLFRDAAAERRNQGGAS